MTRQFRTFSYLEYVFIVAFFFGDHYGDFVAAVSRRDDDRYIYFSTGCVFYFSHIFTKHTFNGYLRAHVLYIRTNVHGEKIHITCRPIELKIESVFFRSENK